MSNREELQRLLRNVLSLLDDENYHPGLWTWLDHYRKALIELADWINYQAQ